MSIKQTIMWTPLPNGWDGEALKLSVLISPRLGREDDRRRRGTNYTLRDFSDFLDWPETIRNTTFKVNFRVQNKVNVRIQEYAATPIVSNLDSALWKALFKADTFVRPHVFKDHSQKRTVSFPVNEVLEAVKQPYVNLALNTVDRLPQVTEVVNTFSNDLDITRHNLDQAMQGLQAEHSIFTKGLSQEFGQPFRFHINPKLQQAADPKTPNAFERLRLFHNPAAGRNQGIQSVQGNGQAQPKPLPSANDFTNPESAACLDFHQMIAALQQYPTLLRKLGLVVDLVITADPQLKPQPQPHWLTIQPDVALQVETDTVLPQIYTRLTTDTFQAACPSRSTTAQSKYPKIDSGMLHLSDSEDYKLVQVDVDGLATRVMNVVSDAAQRERRYPEARAQEEGLPTFRTDGLAVIDTTCDQKLATAIMTGQAKNDVIKQTENATSGTRRDGKRAQKKVIKQTEKGTSGTRRDDKRAAKDRRDDTPDLELYAEELVRGYRIDVWDEQTERWQSLCERIGTYTFTNSGQTPELIQDEGWVQLGVAQSEDGNELFVHQKIFNWQGWSLCAPRPGKKIAPDDQVQDEAQLNEAPEGLGLQVNFRVVPGSLPRLRFGRRYKLRARVVDLAGNGLTLAEANDVYASATQFYARFEPVCSPAMALVEDKEGVGIPREGESTECLAIRSYNDLDQHNGDPAVADAIASNESAQRYLMPPRISQADAETHGMLDTPTGRLNASAYQMLVDRDPQQKELDASQKITVSETTSYTLTKAQGNLKQVEVEQVWGDPQRQSETTYAVGEVPLTPMPYLPDPFARGVAIQFFDLPGVDPDKVHNYPFYPESRETATAWPHAQPFRIQVVERSDSNQPSFDEEIRILTIPLPKAEVARLRISCYFHEDDLEKMGMWHWLKEAFENDHLLRNAVKQLGLNHWAQIPSQEQIRSVHGEDARLALSYLLAKQKQFDKLKRCALNGRQWLLTPWHDITVVHAVQQPLGIPAMQNLITLRKHEDTSVLPAFDALIHRKSTAKFDLLAEWNDPVDDPKDPTGPHNVKRNAYVASAPVTVEEPFDRLGINRPLTARDRPSGQDSGATRGEHTDKEESYLTLRHELGDTKYRKVNYQLETTSRFREYLPYQMTTDEQYKTAFRRHSEKAETFVHNAARPDTPDVLYVIPTFGWERTETEGEITSTRKGGGLRVYLNRPWYSSGYGEMLGVVLPAAHDQEKIPEDLQPYVTQWGRDPISFTTGGGVGTKLLPSPQLEQFPQAITNVQQFIQFEQALEENTLPAAIGNFPISNLALMEGSHRVNVAPHAVNYDQARGLWYCDIELDSGAFYYPFVRLALARYHPASVRDSHLSPVILADFAQLTPDRSVTVMADTTDPNQRNITVTGVRREVPDYFAETYEPAYQSVAEGTPPLPVPIKLPLPTIEITVERFDPQIGTDLGWQPVPEANVVPTHIPPSYVQGKGLLYPTDMRILWQGNITLPVNDGRYRIVIREYEVISVSLKAKTAPNETERRLVYADILELSN